MRADRVIARVLPVLGRGDVALVSHGHFLRVLAARWLSLAPTGGAMLALDTGSVSVLGFEHGAHVLRHWNLLPTGLHQRRLPPHSLLLRCFFLSSSSPTAPSSSSANRTPGSGYDPAPASGKVTPGASRLAHLGVVSSETPSSLFSPTRSESSSTGGRGTFGSRVELIVALLELLNGRLVRRIGAGLTLPATAGKPPG